LAHDLKPYVAAWINAAVAAGGSAAGGGGGGGLSAHALDGAFHTGVLASNQAPQFPLLAGGRTFTGSIVLLDGLTVDGVDLSEHVTNPSAHHNPVTAGDGIDLTGQQVAVDVTDLIGAGLAEIATNNIGLNLAYSPTWTGTHQFNQDPQIQANLDFIGAADRAITAAQKLTIAPTGILVLDPGDLIELPDAQELRTTNFSDLVTGIAGIRLWDRGSNYRQLTMGAIKVDELYARVFVADEVRIDRGEEYWSKSYGIVAADFTIPADTVTRVYVTFEDAPGLATANLFSAGDYLLFRVIDWGTGIVISKTWWWVEAFTDRNDTAKTQRWALFLRSGGTAGQTIKAGSLGLDVGVSGQGWVHLSALEQDGGPFIQLGDWSSAIGATAPNNRPWNPDSFINRVRIGNLNGVGGIATDTWGFAAAKNLGTSIGSGFEGIVADPTNGVRLYNADVKLYDGATQTIWLNATDGLTVLGNATGLPGPYNVVGIALWDELRSVSFWDGSTRFATLGGTKHTAPTPDEWGVALDVIAPASSQRAALQLSVVSTGATVTDTNPILFLEHSGTINRATLAANDVRLRGTSVGVYANEGDDAYFYLYGDEGDDNADRWRFSAGGSSATPVFRIAQYSTGSWVDMLSINNGAVYAEIGFYGWSAGFSTITARTDDGLSFQDNGGNVALTVLDGGNTGIGKLLVLVPQSATISGGAITASASYIALAGETASDDLDTINGGVDGALVTIINGPGAGTLTIKHNTGNLRLAGGADFAMNSRVDTITLIYRAGGIVGWLEVARSNNS
jgi:hypothetical protein